jgi:hypothetical protein
MKRYVAYIGYNWTDDKDLTIVGVTVNKKVALKKLLQEAFDDGDDQIEPDDIMTGGKSYTDDGDRVYGIQEVEDLDEEAAK